MRAPRVQINAINAGKADLAKKKINEPEKGASKEAWDKYNAQLAALAGAAAPYVAEIIGHYSNLDNAGKVAAHAVVNAALAAAQNQSALAGAAGAATAEIVGLIATQMYGKPASELDETQKQTVSILATLAAGLAGGLADDSSASAVSGAQAGRTTVENNSLSDVTDALRWVRHLNKSLKSALQRKTNAIRRKTVPG